MVALEQPANRPGGQAAPGTRSRVGARAHIVFVSLVFHPDTSASSILFTDLFERIAADGSRVTALCGFPSKDTAGEVRALPRRERYGGVDIVRCGLRIQGKRSLVTRTLAYGSFLLHAGWKLGRMGRHAIVAGGTDPPFTPVALWLAGKLGRFQYDCVLLDVYPDGLVALGALNPSSPPVRLWRFLNRRAFARARRVIVLGRDMADLVRHTYGVPSERVVYVPHWATREIDRARDDRSQRPLARELDLDGAFVVQYSGNMGLWHDMDTLVLAADRLRHDAHIRFLFVGKGRRRAGAEALARSLDLANITWLDFQPRDRLPAVLASCDAALISLKDGLEGVAVPSKLYGILASGRPVLAQVPASSEVARVVIEEDCGIVVSPGDPDALAGAIRTLAAHPRLSRRMGSRARAAYDGKYSLDRATAAFGRLWDPR